MKIGYIHDSPMPAPEANTVHVAKMCNAFAANGHDVTLIHPPTQIAEGSPAAYYGLPHLPPTTSLHRGRFFGGRRLYATLAALRMRARGVDIVYARKAELLQPALRLGMRCIFETHEDIGGNRPRGQKALRKIVGRPNLLRTVVISEALRETMAEQWPPLAPLLMVAHDGADAVAPGSVVPVPRPPGRPRVGYAGHLYPGKGMELIFELATRRPDIDFLILGGKGDDLDRWRQATADMANVTMTGMVPHAQVPAYLLSCDVVLAPYGRQVGTTDGRSDIARWMSPLKIFEYMALGLPMMVSDLPVIREVLEDGRDALLCTPGEAGDWLTRLDALLADREARATLGAAARAKLEARFTWRIRARDVLAGL